MEWDRNHKVEFKMKIAWFYILGAEAFGASVVQLTWSHECYLQHTTKTIIYCLSADNAPKIIIKYNDNAE